MGLFSGIADVFGLGGESGAEKDLRRLANAGFDSPATQKFLPPQLQAQLAGPIVGAGIRGIGDLIQNPGRLGANVEQAILPRLAAESENITKQFRGIGANQTGRAARTNLPLSIKNALASALDVAQARAQRGARREALSDSDRLRRRDLSQTFAILDAILQFISSGRGQAVSGLGGAGQLGQRRQAANLAAISSFIPKPG